MKTFIAKHNVFETEFEFTESSAPDWLTAKSAIKGSTMDSSWFWREHVLTLDVGKSVETDFHTIRRIA